jgi:predicted DNA-binding protein with PD1-like motif
MKKIILALALITTSAFADIQVRALRLTPGQDVKNELDAFITKNKIEAASILSAVGSVKQAKIRFANKKETTDISGPLEVVSFSGTLGVGGTHLHIALSDAEGKVVGGHLSDGTLVYTTLELVLGVYPGLSFQRVQDIKTGYKELNIKVKLVGFKSEYNLENSDGYKNTVTIEQKYNVMKRKMEVIENKETFFE